MAFKNVVEFYPNCVWLSHHRNKKSRPIGRDFLFLWYYDFYFQYQTLLIKTTSFHPNFPLYHQAS
jgi:hypothetical protein